MTKTDVETAIERKYRKNFHQLRYVPKTDFVRIDDSVLVQLRREFDGEGEYPITIDVKLFVHLSTINSMVSAFYTLETKVLVDCGIESEPVISFNSDVFVRKNG